MLYFLGPDGAEMVQQARLDGANPGVAKVLIRSKIMPSSAEQQARAATGTPVPYEDTQLKKIGIWNLRGYVDADGRAHFVGERDSQPGATQATHATGIVHWDGQKLDVLYAYKSTPTLSYCLPPMLMLDEKGREHLILIPEMAETTCVRDYTLSTDGGKVTLGDDPVTVIATKDASGALGGFQAAQGPGGRMMVISTRKNGVIDDLELYLSIYDGGKWMAPLLITDNAYRKTFFHRESGGGNSVERASSYFPQFAAAALDRNGHPVILMTNVEHHILGVNNPGSVGGAPVLFNSGYSINAPMIFFLKL